MVTEVAEIPPNEIVRPQNPDDPDEEKPKKLTKAEKKALYKKDYPEPLNTRRKMLKDVYTMEKDKDMREELMRSISYEILEMEDNPYNAAMDLYDVLHDVSIPKMNTLAGTFIQFFRSWLEKLDPGQAYDLAQRCLSDDLKLKAIRLFSKHHVMHFQMVEKMYCLTEEEYLPAIKDQITKFSLDGKFKEALELAHRFNVVEEYDLDDFIIPCVLQDRLAVVEDCIKGNEILMKALVSFLDNFVSRDADFVNANLQPYAKCMTVSADKFCGKTIAKTVKGVLSAFQWDEDEKIYAPRKYRHSLESHIAYLVRSRFPLSPDTPAQTEETFNGLIKIWLKDQRYENHIHCLRGQRSWLLWKDNEGYLRGTDREMQDHFIRLLLSAGRKLEAAVWSAYYNLGIKSPTLDIFIRENCEQVKNGIAKLEAELSEIREFMLNDYIPVKFVDKWEDMIPMLQDFREASVIGIDTEWKPQYKAKNDQVALLQASTDKRVYLVDFFILEDVLTSDQWREFFEALFQCEAIKLGFDFSNDFRALFASKRLSEFKYFELENKNVLCLKRFMENILYTESSFIDLSRPQDKLEESESEKDFLNQTSTSSSQEAQTFHFKLSDLSEKLLNKKLGKAEQCSNWAQRPMTESQLKYAALDAYILIELYNEIVLRMSSFPSLELQPLVESSLVTAPKRERIRKAKAKLEEMAWLELVEQLNRRAIGDVSRPKKPEEFKCIVDLNLVGLGKHLRRVGVDVVMVQSKVELHTHAKLSQRFVLTSGKAYDQLRQMFANVVCIPNASSSSSIDQVKFVLEKFNIQLSKDKIFSRCMECNKAAFLRVPGPVVQALYEWHVTCQHLYNDSPFDLIGWKQRLQQLRPEDYGIEYEFKVHHKKADWLCVWGDTGVIDIKNNIVHHKDLLGSQQTLIERMEVSNGAPTMVKKVPDQVIARGVRIFYICCGCGKIYWDGAHAANYSQTADDLIQHSLSRQRNSHSETDSEYVVMR